MLPVAATTSAISLPSHLRQSLQVSQTCGTHVYSIWLRGAIADHVITHLAPGRFHSLINFARWNCEALSNDLKVIDERFHLRLHFFAIGKHYFGSVRLDRSFRHAIKRLLHHGNRFSELLHAAHISREYITIRRNRHLELEPLVAGIRHISP